MIHDNVPETTFKTWFEPIVPLKYEDKALTIGVPSPFFYEFLEEKLADLLRATLNKQIGEGTRLMYSVLTDKTNHISVNMESTNRSSAVPAHQTIRNGNKTPNPMQAPAPQDLDPHLNPNYNFENFIKGSSNEFSRTVGETVAKNEIALADEKVSLSSIYGEYESVLESVYPTNADEAKEEIPEFSYKGKKAAPAVIKCARPKVLIPVFPGTNCEYDSKRAFERAGAKVRLVVIRNKTTQDIIDSVNELEEAIYSSQIMMLPGGFSAGDEPEGSGKFIATFLRNPKLKAAISDLLDNRDGLMIGICNGFQALIKLGLLPYGKIKDMTDTDPTLTFNTIARHVSQMVQTKIVSVKSPWLANVNVGDLHTIAVSHGEGRFVAPKEVIDNLFASGQVFSLYTDNLGNPTMQSPYNPNGSMMGIEGIVSCDGRILGKMGHSERQGVNRNKNIYGEMDQQLFEAGVNYFKKK